MHVRPCKGQKVQEHEPIEQTIDMIEREEGDRLVTLTIGTTIPRQVTGFAGAQHQAIRYDILVAEHDAFGQTRCPRRVDQEREIFLRVDFGSTIL